jgi:hypothetical protein
MRFNEIANRIDLTQEGISLAISFDYQFHTMPPFIADRGSFNVTLQNVELYSEFSIAEADERG